MATVEFVEQLPKRSVTRVHQVNEELKTIAEQLAQRPGLFARIASRTPSFGSFYGLKELGCEITLRNVGTQEVQKKDGTVGSQRLYDVYARFIVPEPEAEKPKGKGKK